MKSITWEFFLAFIGALAWLPWIFEKIKSPKIYGNLISSVISTGHFNERSGLLYYFKLSISCINKNYNVESVNIYVKYPNEKSWKKGHVFWARTLSWDIEDEIKFLKLPTNNFLGFINILEKDKPNFYHLTFLVEEEKPVFKKYEKIKFEFVNFKGRKKTFEILQENINPDLMLFDDDFWS